MKSRQEKLKLVWEYLKKYAKEAAIIIMIILLLIAWNGRDTVRLETFSIKNEGRTYLYYYREAYNQDRTLLTDDINFRYDVPFPTMKKGSTFTKRTSTVDKDWREQYVRHIEKK